MTKRKTTQKMREQDAWLDLWMTKQMLMARRDTDLEKRMEAVELVIQDILMNSIARHIPPHILNPDRNAPVQPPAVLPG